MRDQYPEEYLQCVALWKNFSNIVAVGNKCFRSIDFDSVERGFISQMALFKVLDNLH
jgi:hypothetical protein